ncbi:hypothetical protein QTP70_019031 [Hemibagrus guttatus]|uniref:ribonuclease H n=1 Tax=Hemibagrus guttatus TaxID=175788 RepID=A0AAE0RGM4_9TELE|nr:hypothetical protein QTP70_019031 [Hemibagrus guttatus]
MADWKPASQRPGEVLGEECQQYAETRRSLKKNVKELQEIIQAMMQENEKLPDIEKLELMEFNLDVDEQQRLQAEGEQEIAKVREEIEMENLAKSYLRDVLKKKYWDAMSVKEKAIKAFHSGCEVENFPMKERTAEELEELHRVEAIREMEKADTSVCSSYVSSVVFKAPLEEDEEDNCHEAGSLAFTGSLSAQYGGFNPHLYSQFDLHTRDQKMNQIILLQDVIYKVKTAFNTDFEAVYKQKEQVMSYIREKNKCLADIMSTLELQETLWEPTLSDNERPERALTVSDSEIKVEKYLTPEQRQREEEQRKEEEQRRLIEKEDDSRERALDDMMGGILEVKREDILKMEVPAPEFIDKPELQWTEEERGSYKEYERQVKKLREEQKSYRKEELKIANLLHSTIIEEEMLDREEELIYRLQEAKAVKNEIRKRLTNHREDVEDFQETYDTTVRGDKILGSGFRKEFCDVPRYTLDQLYKLYKRRPRIQIMRALTTEGLSHIMKAMEALDAPQNMPEGLDPAVWERFCLARRTKVKSEQKVKMKAMVLAEKQAFLQKIIDEEENAKMEIKNLVDELNCLRDERLTLSSNVIVQILLKQCQVEVENGDFAADYSDSLLFQRNVVEDLNNTIRALGKQQIAFMVEHKDLHKIIIQQEWEHKRLSMQIEDLRNNARDIQLLHQYREVLEIHRKNVKNCERLLKELGRQVKEKKKINAALDLKFTNLQVAVAERRNIYETTAFEENQQRKAKQRYRNIVQKRKLVDLAKAQDMDIAVLSTELKCVLGEECQQYAETRRSLKKNVKELQEIIQAMMQENEKLPDIEKLELMEFNLDVDEQQRLQAEGEQEIAKVREEIEMENLAKSYLRDVLKKKYWDAMSVKEKAIKAFHSGCEVENFPMKERTAEELEELHRVEAIREMEKADTSAPLEEDEEDNCHEAGSLAFTGSLSAQYGGVNPHLYSQFDLHTRDQKMNQIILLQDVIYKVKTAFNTDFEAVYKQKEQVMSCIREKNKCLADMSTLELQETLWEPTLSDNERPERALTVSDSEIKVEKYLTPEQRQREEEQRKEEEQRRLIEKEDDSRERALDDMMGGILEVKREDILKMEVPAPEFIDKPELQWTEEERGSYKEYERQVKKLREEQKSYRKILEEQMKKLQASINDDTQAFDEILSKLYERKLKSEMAIYQAKLKIANLLHSTIIEEEMLDREEELIYRLQEAKAVKNEIRKRLTNHREDVEDFQETYDTTVRGDKILGSGFRKEFCDVPRYTLDQLYKLYKRRPRIQIMRALTTEGLSHIMKAMEALDAPQNMPEGLDPAVWERFCLARRTKVKSEQKVKMKAMVLAEKQAFLQKIIDEEENAKMEIKNLVDELNCLRDERLTLSSNVIVQILLKQCQVEVENGDFAADYSDSLLFQRNVVEDLNNTIRALGKQQIAFMVEHKDLHKIIIQQEWEHKRLSMQIEDLRNNARDIQLLHQYREVLEIHRKNVKNCERLLKELGRQVKEKKKINAALDLKFTNLQVAVAERRNIYETTGKGRELADMMERRKVDILCVQETRWKGSKARSIGAGFKLFYYGVDSKRNGVGVVLKEEFVRNVLEVGCELEEKERFWSELDEVMESIPTGERVVIGADFNGDVGEGNTGDEEVMGKFGVKERNLEGQMVVDFAKRMDMAVVNTYFQKREEHRVTYKSGGRRTQKKRQKLRQALGGQVVLPDDWETTAEVIRETGRKVLGVSSGRRKEDKETWWWNEEVQDSIQRKRLAKKKWDMDRTEENRQEYKELQRRVKREVSKAKQKAYDELYTRLDTREGEKDLYRLARQRDRDGKDVQQVRVIKDRDGRVLTSEESVQRRWKEYFEELMNEENEREKRVEGVNSVEQKVDKIRKDEVRKALKRMKSGKAVGPDDIPVEVWKCLGEAAVEFLTSLFNRVLESERMPEEWRRSVLVPIFKNKGDVQSCSNYRGIKLMSHTMKLWERVVEARLRKVVEICEQQYGFMPRKSTTDAIFALRILMEKYRDGQRELHCVFVDLEKAYDRVPREELWYCMRKSGVAEKYVRVVQDMYERSRTVVRCAVGQTEEFNVQVGLHQGSALSPFLFAIVMDQLSEEVRHESPWTMMFADDIVICSESREQVEENLERWRFALERRGMKVSRSKTEYMCVNGREGSGTVRLQGEEVKKVQEFKYLGSTVQSNGECGKETKSRNSLFSYRLLPYTELADVLTSIFNLYLSQSTVSTCFKTTTIVPLPKKSPLTCLNNYRSVALNPIIMKCFEKVVQYTRHIGPPAVCMPAQQVMAVNKQPIGDGYITHQTVPITLQVRLFHVEEVVLFVISFPSNPIILGFPRLQLHNPQVHWKDNLLSSPAPSEGAMMCGRVPMCRPTVAPTTETTDSNPPPLLKIEGSPAYLGHEILDCHRRGGQTQYLVDWRGYSPKEKSLVLANDILDPSLISDFHQVHPDRPTPRALEYCKDLQFYHLHARGSPLLNTEHPLEVKMGRGSPIPPMLRRKIVEQYQKGVSQRKTAKSLKSSSSTMHNIIQRFRESGTISVRKGQGQKTILDARDLRALRRHCITYRNATVMEITTWAQEYFQKTLSVNTIHRAIRRCRLKLYRSKNKPYLNMIQKRRCFLWAKAHLKWTVAKWKTVLWSDESKFEVLFGKLGRHVIRTKEDKDNPSCYQRSVQKPASLMCPNFFGIGFAFHSGCELENFPMKERTAEEQEELYRVEAIREMEKADTSAPLEEDEEDNCHEAGSLAFTGSLSAQYGGFNPHLYSQFDLHTRDQKMNQIILLQDVIYKVKTAFNTDFEAVYKQKEQVMSCIREKNKCLADIMSTLELQETLWEPTLSDNERPERALTVSDSETKVEKYLTPEQRQREEEQRKEEEQRQLIEKEDDSRERALDDMMGGILEVKREDILKMEVPAPEFIDKPELQWTEEERGSYKEYERQVKKLREEQKSYRKVKMKAMVLAEKQAFLQKIIDEEENAKMEIKNLVDELN